MISIQSLTLIPEIAGDSLKNLRQRYEMFAVDRMRSKEERMSRAQDAARVAKPMARPYQSVALGVSVSALGHRSSGTNSSTSEATTLEVGFLDFGFSEPK